MVLFVVTCVVCVWVLCGLRGFVGLLFICLLCCTFFDYLFICWFYTFCGGLAFSFVPGVFVMFDLGNSVGVH